MIYFLHGPDSYRSKKKLEEIIEGYKKVHKSGLNLIYINAESADFRELSSSLNTISMFSENKLLILRNLFSAPGGPASGWQESFLENIKDLADLKDIVVVYENGPADKRTKLFKALEKHAKYQEFEFLLPANLRKWVLDEFTNNKAKIETDALNLLVEFVGNDLWQMANEINKLSNYKKGSVIKKEDVETLVRPKTENDIFKTIEALASKDKKQALNLLHKHLEKGDSPLYLLSMIAFQFRNLLIVKQLLESAKPYGAMAKKSGLHPFVFQKSYYICNKFSLLELKKIYHKIFETDLNIKTGKIEPETALDILLAQI